MKRFLIFLFSLIIFKETFQINPCQEIAIKPYESNQVIIKRLDASNCSYFSFDNPTEGNIILKLTKSNSFTSYIYVYASKDEIDFNTETNEFANYHKKYHIGEDFFKELKIENLEKKTYYFIIYEQSFNFNDELIIYNDNFTQNNYYEINQISNPQKNELNFKYEYSNESPIIIHFKTNTDKVKYLNYQFINTNQNGKTSFYVIEGNLENGENKENVENIREKSNYISLKTDTDYFIKIVTDGEINIILEFLDSKILKINPEDIFQKEFIAQNEYYFYIEKDLIIENDEYFNEFTVKLDAINLNNLVFDISTNTCNDNSEEGLIKCINDIDNSKKTIIKRDIDIPYIYHVYYSFNNQKYIVIKIQNKKTLEYKQRFILESSGGNDLIDNKSEKVYTNNKGYLYPVYLNVSISDINNENNKNKNRLLIINTNTTSAIKIFYNDNTFKNENIDIDKSEYIKIENYFYGFDFNEEKTKNLFGNRKYFTVLIYSPWESSPISFQLTFINNNEHNFKYILGQKRPSNSQIEVNLKSINEKYYFIGQYNENSTNILFNEVVYGKISAKYKVFDMNDKISRIIFNDTANGYSFQDWISIGNRIDIIEITCLSPALIYMHCIEDQAIKINDIILDKGSQNYIFLNNTNTYNLMLSEDLKKSTNVNVEVFLVSQINGQLIDIIINGQNTTLSNDKDNNYLRFNTNDKYLESFVIQGRGNATLIRIKIGINTDDKKIAFYKEYKKSEEKKISTKINVNINNKNIESVKLCYSFNFEEGKYIHLPKNENCFELNKNEKTTLSMYNPWNKYLENNNKLYFDSDLYYLVIYSEDESIIGNLEFKDEEEFIEINNEIKETEFINIDKTQNNIVKSSHKENQMILIQFSPISNNITDSEDDKFVIKSQFDEIIQEGKIYSKNNRTYVAFNDQMVDSYLMLDIHNNKKYDIKYSVFSNENNITEENINDDYKIELINTNQELPYAKFKPLLKQKDIEYSIYISFDKNLELSSVINLMKLKSNENKLYIMTKSISSEDFIKFDLTSEISNLMNNKKWALNVLAKEKEKYNIIMNYDMIEGGEDKDGGEKKDNKENNETSGGTSAGIIILWILIVIIILAGAYAVYYFLFKKRFKKTDELLNEIDKVTLSMEDQANSNKINYEEGNVI